MDEDVSKLDEPTVITSEDIDNVINDYLNKEIHPHKCSKEYYFGSYGHHIGECDECWFSRFPKEQVEEFCRIFF